MEKQIKSLNCMLALGFEDMGARIIINNPFLCVIEHEELETIVNVFKSDNANFDFMDSDLNYYKKEWLEDIEVKDVIKIDKLSFLEVQLSIVIDNIDTASDIAKEDSEMYRRLVKDQIERFRELISNDGYKFYKNCDKTNID